MAVQPQGLLPSKQGEGRPEAGGRAGAAGPGPGRKSSTAPSPQRSGESGAARVHARADGSACARGQPPSDPSRRRLTRPPSSSAYDARLRQKVAVKKLSRPFQSLIHARRTYRELRLLKHLKHENVSRGRAVGGGRVQGRGRGRSQWVGELWRWGRGHRGRGQALRGGARGG